VHTPDYAPLLLLRDREIGYATQQVMLILLPDTRPGALQSIDEDRAQIVQQARSGWQRVCLVCLIEACRRWQLKQAW
jgi:hypothetical protein